MDLLKKNTSKYLKSRAHGLAFVEFVIVLPLLVLLLFGFWDLVVTEISHLRHATGVSQVLVSLPQTPLRAAVVSSAGSPPAVTVSPLSSVQLLNLTPPTVATDPPIGFLPTIHNIFNGYMSNAGTGAAAVKHNIALRLVYFCISDPDSEATPPYFPLECLDGGAAITSAAQADSYLPTWFLGGWAYSHFTAPTNPLNPADPNTPPQNFYTGMLANGTTVNNDCFDSDNGNISAELDNFVNAKANLIVVAGAGGGVSDPPSPAPIPFGSKVVDVQTSYNDFGDFKGYVQFRPILFYVACSRPFRFFRQGPILDYGLLFFDREVGI